MSVKFGLGIMFDYYEFFKAVIVFIKINYYQSCIDAVKLVDCTSGNSF